MYTLIIFSLLVFLPLPVMASTGRKSGSGYRAIFEGVMSVAMAMLLMFCIAAASGHPIGKLIAGDLHIFAEAAAQNEMLVNMLGMEDASASERVAALTSVYTYTINALPAVVLVWCTVLSYFEYRIVSKLSRKMKNPLPMLTPFHEFTLPKTALWGWVLIYLMTLIAVVLDIAGSNVLEANIQVLFQFVFQIQGMAVIFYFCHQKKLPVIVPVLLCALFYPTAIGQLMLSLLGFLDLGFGLRKAITKH